jgi:hypothetical protein
VVGPGDGQVSRTRRSPQPWAHQHCSRSQIYEQKIVARFGGQREFKLAIPDQSAQEQEAAN